MSLPWLPKLSPFSNSMHFCSSFDLSFDGWGHCLYLERHVSYGWLLKNRFLFFKLFLFSLLLWIRCDCFFIFQSVVPLIEWHHCDSVRTKAELQKNYNYVCLCLRASLIFYKVLLSIASNGLSFPRPPITLQSV